MAQKEKTKPIIDELAASGDGIASQLGGFISEIALPDDPLLKAMGWNMDKYVQVLRDEQVRTTLAQRRAAVVQAEWEVIPGGSSALDKKAAESLKEQLSNVGIDSATRKMLYGLFYGYSVAECMWSVDGREVILDEIKVRKARRFRFGKDGTLRLLTKEKPQGLIMPDQKFWIFTVEDDNDDTPYGVGLAQGCYWPVFLKRNGLKFWSVALEKFGTPTAVGKFANGSPDKEKSALLTTLGAIATDSAVIIPENMSVELVEAVRRAGGDHEVFCKYLDAMISKVVLGQSATTETAAWRGTAEVQQDAGNNILKEDADLLCETFNNGPAKWLTDWNYPGAAYPKLWRQTEPEDDLNERIDRDSKIHTMGFKLRADYIENTYNVELDHNAMNTAKDNKAALDFAENTRKQDEIERAVQEALEDWEPIMNPVLQPFFDLMEEAETLEEVRDRLGEVAQKMDSTAFQELMHQLGFSASISGQLGIEFEE